MNELSTALSVRTLRRVVPALILAGGALLAVLAAGPAQAEREHGRHEHRREAALPVLGLPAYAQECGSCHIAFPPGMLPASSWNRMMGQLERHFGTDASLEPMQRDRIRDWLQKEAGTSRRVSTEPPDDRITRSTWFVRKHDELRTSVWRRPSVRSAANCAACHPGAERGDFDEDSVRIPR